MSSALVKTNTDRVALIEWFEDHDTSPKTGIELAHKNFAPNVVLATNLDEWKRKSGFRDNAADKGDGDDGDSDDETSEEELAFDPQRGIDRMVMEDLYAATMGETCWENIEG